MKLIANETEYARRCLEQNYIDKKKPYKSIRTVVRYLKKICYITDLDDMYYSILTYIESTGKQVKIDKDVIRTMMNEDNPYNDLSCIYISENEMNKITSLNYPNSWKKVLFTMLVHYKTKLQLYPEAKNKRIDADLSMIMNDAHVTLSVAKRMEMLAQFEEDGLIELPNGGKQAQYIYLHYVDDYVAQVAIIVEDFFDFYLYYEQYAKGGRLIRCSECGKLVLVKDKAPGKYCKKCAKELAQESRKMYMREQRK